VKNGVACWASKVDQRMKEVSALTRLSSSFVGFCRVCLLVFCKMPVVALILIALRFFKVIYEKQQ
jgi:hypothetical protein